MSKLLAFGDSWTIGDCTDLIDEKIIPYDDNVSLFYDTAKVFKKPWPNIVAERMGLAVKNFGLSGNCNKTITTQIYDYHLFHGFDKTDIVIVSLSTWHRSYSWQADGIANGRNELIFKDTSCKYGSVFPSHSSQGFVEINDPEKIAYDAFFDFYTIKNYLDNIGVKYYIGWAFTAVSDFSIHLNSAYTKEILETKNLLEPFFNFCKRVNFQKLLHPTLEDHTNYANYIHKRIKEDGI